ncbi:MAG: UDP-N-acetylmuramoyl-L-alanyl-D-glutamate--2,6-diaminopimelate ligase [Candidatus Cloacimonetes bacterium]|nr:UDP-N-acetylmuramoyl-L-alanyl-D-glutamate--2,6-diaminopimelate ligase [Candidatus Cloacimonadota bacterium]MCF7814119.1 UDP-N-acetylmuramoyl-L-alanyl-D-glutamate--2,6-diaminopimelate ligase [Candidatus Cloacimonadota bacterium]MCF7868732.1 UDP-N-acetylmuramoyl-L-alanyl-D-glutamate--2,6-diaminopimelate ligase [Candidatus Cloacimonadota bacterium]MCF7884118.1 UDP-N-acetylmuramoyl-L-alanyl-D-glutamate--2,6-diaminopimelate ligase [Candidatus Cloacimonadota bacterium]
MCSKSQINYKQIKAVLQTAGLYLEGSDINSETKYNKFETDSRRIAENDVFICIKGFQTDGHLFAEKALNNGAKLLIVDHKLELNVPQIVVTDSRKAAAVLAKLYFDDPTSKFKLIGITGTNGKTTIAHLIYQILVKNNVSVGMIGTLGYKINNESFSTERTTPDIFDLNKIFAEMVGKNIKYVVMEVSSHALALQRIYDCNFDLAIFSNLSQDHLDFHASLQNYANSKFQLFNYLKEKNGTAIINIDDEFGKQFYEKLKIDKKGISFQKADYKISNIKTDISGSEFQIILPQAPLFKGIKKEGKIKTNLIGKYNIFNLTAAITACLELKVPIPDEQLVKIIIELETVEGRLQAVPNQKDIGIYIDYAHTPDALQNVLKTLKEVSKKRLICVFGAGGNRDRSKRPKMLEAALQNSDLTIITNDNPRDEEPADIIRDIIAKAEAEEKLWIIRDRKIAIETAIQAARKGDIVLIAGKGHETYQEIKGIKHHFDDLKIATEALNKSSSDALSFPIDPVMLEMIFKQKFNIENDEMIFHVSTDSRSIKPNSLFFALQGQNFDGHDYVENALKIDNCWAVVDKNFTIDHANLVRVDDTLQAYGKLAAKYKTLFDVTSVAITGSSGKTTVKEYLANILSRKYEVHKTFSNENNLIGLPKTIFKLQHKHDVAILELGTNQFGEIEKLTDIASPDISVITSIGPSHLEFLIDEKGVFKEKIKIFKLKKSIKIFPGDDKRFKDFEGITFGEKDSNNYKLSDIKQDDEKTEFKINNKLFSIPTPFSTFSQNALIAAAISFELGFDKTTIQAGFDEPLNIANRMNIFRSKGKIILADCYNANPDSMKAAIQFWLRYKPQNPHVAILGDMLELGELTEKYHRNILHQLDGEEIEELISVGFLSRNYKADRHFQTVEELLDSDMLNNFPNDSIILIKASHSIKLEKILERI